jgi:N-acetylglucosaminyldiphosphoundecaprenol N-acetyl-beta-D-mannosaminyltransferase
LLGIPIRERVSGSNLVERLFDQKNSLEKYKIFYFGGQDDVADRANENTEKKSEAAVGVGAISPGFVSVDVMSKPEYIQKINESDADLLVVALGAKKGQDWIVKNLPDLTVPVVSHLGAVVNFVAGTVSRSPGWMQKTGLEWLWRIKEENTLLRRYWNDGLRFLVLLWRDVLPQLIRKKMPDDGNISLTLSGDCLLIKGALTVNTVSVFVTELLHCLTSPELRAIDLSSCKCLDARGIGALMMLRKHRPDLKILNASEGVERIFRENNASYLLEKNRLRMA